MFQRLLEYLLHVPAATLYAVVALLAAVENVFPPIPSDTALVLGALASSGGRASAVMVFLVSWVANSASAAAVYFMARRFGRPMFRGTLGRRLMNPVAFQRLERLYAEHGVWGIFLSRFVPGVRAVVPPFAGVAGLGPWRTLVPTVVASGIWHAALVILVVKFAGEIHDAVLLVDRLNLWTAVSALAIAVVIGLVAWIRRRPPVPGPGGPP